MANQFDAWLVGAGLGRAEPALACRGVAWRSPARRSKARNLQINFLPAPAWHGMAGQGEARQRKARFNKSIPTWPGESGLGSSRHGPSGHGESWQGCFLFPFTKEFVMKIGVWKLTGISPLLQNNPAETMQSGGDGLTAGKKKYDDKEEAEMRVYKDEAGKYYHPAASIRSSVLEAAKGRKIGKKAARAVLSGTFFPMEEKMLLNNGDGKPIKKYEIHKARCKIGKAGILRCRPMFSKWSTELPIEYDDQFINSDVVTEMLNIAGRIIGIGDFRPDTSGGKTGVGTFGRFKAEFVK